MTLAKGPQPAWPTTARSFIDTNILVYADDQDEPARMTLARDLLRRHAGQGTAVISTQVLQEYFSTVTRKLGLPPDVAQRRVEGYARLSVVQNDVSTILAAIDLHRLHQISFWDALIVQAAKAGGCTLLLSEDMHDGASLRGLRVVNPFAGLSAGG